MFRSACLNDDNLNVPFAAQLLDLDDNKITDDGAIAIAAAIVDTPLLSHVWLSNNAVSDGTAKAMCTAVLAIEKNTAAMEWDEGDAAAAAAADRTLTLNINGNAITETGVVSLSACMGSPALKWLAVADNKFKPGTQRANALCNRWNDAKKQPRNLFVSSAVSSGCGVVKAV